MRKENSIRGAQWGGLLTIEVVGGHSCEGPTLTWPLNRRIPKGERSDGPRSAICLTATQTFERFAWAARVVVMQAA